MNTMNTVSARKTNFCGPRQLESVSDSCRVESKPTFGPGSPNLLDNPCQGSWTGMREPSSWKFFPFWM